MVLHVLRALFILLLAAVGWSYLKAIGLGWLSMPIGIMVGVLFLCIDILSPRKKLAIFAGTFFGVVVGIVIAYALSFLVQLLVEQYYQPPGDLEAGTEPAFETQRENIIKYINMLVAVVSCYLSISFILQTKDDFRFIIPYVEFSRQTKGARPILLDTSVLVDGRIADIASTGVLESGLIVPGFVLEELQAVADSADRLKRNRGRRGLDVLGKLKNNKRVEITIATNLGREDEDDAPPPPSVAAKSDAADADAGGGSSSSSSAFGVDRRLVELAKELNARILTNDYNLNKVAQLRGVDVINVNDLANALKPVVLPGEMMSVRLVKPGEAPGQGVGYLEDGTMVVVEQGRQHLNEEVEFLVTNAMQTSAGKMIFGRLRDAAGAADSPPATAAGAGAARKSRPRPDPQSAAN